MVEHLMTDDVWLEGVHGGNDQGEGHIKNMESVLHRVICHPHLMTICHGQSSLGYAQARDDPEQGRLGQGGGLSYDGGEETSPQCPEAHDWWRAIVSCDHRAGDDKLVDGDDTKVPVYTAQGLYEMARMRHMGRRTRMRDVS